MTTLSNFKNKLKLPKGKASLDARKARVGWVFVLPFIIGLLLIYLPIVIDSISFSFSTIFMEQLPGGGAKTVVTPAGFRYYKEAFSTSDFATTLLDGVVQLVWEVPAVVIFSLFVAVILNQRMMGRAVFRVIFFVPVILATGLMEAVNATDTLSGEGGIDDGSGASTSNELISMVDVQLLFSNMKVGTELVTYVVNLVNDIYNIINYSGVQMLIFLAGLQSISPAIYEACRIDGASAWETFWKVTFPMVSPMVLVNGIYTVIDSFTRHSNVVMTAIQKQYDAGGWSSKHLATAEAWMYFIVVMLVVAVFAGIMSAFVFYQKRD